ncbi:unnamed protein product [Dovyalis caffra]|uniref:RWD domain-containing protein n=1 Tax=Dovyalis caffra TaxID=77055 RepID=A0AAV1SW35_9ROSI|nr:unnamed protein product [Dovyalis caffra]
MAMIYTLVTSAKEWLSERYGQDTSNEDIENEEAAKDDVIVPHGEPVTVETFLAWRERFEAELALERANKHVVLLDKERLMPESALTAPKEKKLTGRQWYESGKAKGAVAVNEESDQDDEEINFDDDDFEAILELYHVHSDETCPLFDIMAADDEEDMLEHYLAEKSDSSHSSRRAA